MALLLLIIVIAAASLIPLELTRTWVEIRASLRDGMSLAVHGLTLRTLAERLAAFTTLGFLAFRQIAQRGWRHPRLASCALVVLFAFVVELAQALVSVRHAILWDFAVASGAGIIGVALHPAPGTWRSRARHLLAGLLVLGNFVGLYIVAIAHSGNDVDDWDRSYPLLFANELTWDRPWLGRARGVAVYPRELEGGEILRLSRAPIPENVELRSELGALVLYVFASMDRGRTPQAAPGGPAIDLVLEEVERRTGGLEDDGLVIRAPVLIRSSRSPSEIYDAVTESHAFAVETEVESFDLKQVGPARIVSSSKDPYERNFTVGEQWGDLVLRVRTPRNGLNGTRIQLRTESQVMAGGLHHIVATFGRGTARLFVDGLEAAPPLRFHSVVFVDQHRTASTGICAGVVFFVTGVVAAFLFAGRGLPLALLMGYLAAASLPLASALLVTLWNGRDLDLTYLAGASAGPMLGFLVGWGWVGHRPGRHRVS